MFNPHKSLDRKSARGVRIATLISIVAVAIGFSGSFHDTDAITTFVALEMFGLTGLLFARALASDMTLKYKTMNFKLMLGLYRIIGICLSSIGIVLLLESFEIYDETTNKLTLVVFLIPGIYIIFFGSRLLIQKGILGGSKSKTTGEISESSSFYQKYNEGLQYLIFGIIFTLGVIGIFWRK
jgi:hypothetical protein